MLNLDYNIADLNGKTILVTGAGETVVAQIRSDTSNENVHFIHLDVTSWTSQVNFFRQAVQLSPHGGIDAVVANAGINDREEARRLEKPTVDYLNDANPPAPGLKTVNVNLTGVLYTVHLAQWFLPRNPGSQSCSEPADQTTTTSPRDRHILLIGSKA